jgi:DNA polymerase-1
MTAKAKTKTAKVAPAAEAKAAKTAPAAALPAPGHVYLIDGSGYLFRAYFAISKTRPMTRSDGTPTSAVFGFTNMMLKLIADAEADPAVDYFAVIFDSARVSFRNDIYDQYKANRPEPPDDLIPQFPLVRDATRAMNVPCIEMPGYEADDLIATYARQAAKKGMEVTIVSSDKDLMQLVAPGIAMLDPINNRKIGRDEVIEKFGVPPEKVIDVQSLAGDSTDNVPGVPGIGIKTAAELITTYGDLDTLLARAEEIKQPKRRENLIANAELARISRTLVTLKDDVPVKETLEDLRLRPRDPVKLRAFLEAQEFKSTLQRLSDQLGPPAEAAAPEGAPPAPAAVVHAKRPDKANYVLIQKEALLADWIARATAQGVVAVDTETTSLDAVRAELVGVSMALADGQACYIPVGHTGPGGAGGLDLDGPRPEQIARNRAVEMLKKLLEDPAVLKVGHNIKYDVVVLRRYGIETTPVDDTMLLSYVLEGGLHGHGMDELSELMLDHKTIKFTDVTGSGKNQVTFDRVPLDKATDYAAEDADVTWRLFELLKPRLVTERMATVYETIERPLIPVLVDMERAGIIVDRAELHRLSRDFGERIQALETEIHKLAGRPFNIGSPKQLGEVLFDELGLGEGKKGKTGAYSTGADVLEGLAAQGHDLPARVLDWRQLSKLKSTYADALVEQINPETGRVHTSYAMAIASTGRLSSTDPNLQNIPVRTEEGRKIRRAFVAAPGMTFVSLDYSQIELRLLAHVADIAALKKAFRDGVDIHALTASEMFGVPVKGMDPMVRRRAKAINFGIIYGISAFGLANQLGIERDEAARYINAYFERYPGIRAYMDASKTAARERGYVTTPFGRKIYIPGIKDKNPAMRSFSERAAINAPLQGGAADIIKRAMIRVPAALEKARLKARMLLQVHDELLFEVPKAEVDKTIATVKALMERACQPAAEITVPLVVEAGVGANWAEAH